MSEAKVTRVGPMIHGTPHVLVPVLIDLTEPPEVEIDGQSNRGPIITCFAMFGTGDQFHAREAEINQLYDALDDWVSARSVHGRGRTEGAVQFRGVANPEIARIKRELRRRHLPTDRWLYEAELQAQDARDEAETRQGVIAAGYPY